MGRGQAHHRQHRGFLKHCSLTALLALICTVLSQGQDADHVGYKLDATDEAVMHREEGNTLRSLDKEYRQRRLQRKKKSAASILFPGVAPVDYEKGEEIPMFVDLVESKKTQVPFAYYRLPVCHGPPIGKTFRMRKSLGAKLQGSDLTPSPYPIQVLENLGCTPICVVKVSTRQLKWMRKLIQRQYRIHVSLDSLPVLMRSKEFKYAVRGYPVGFNSPGNNHEAGDMYLYNHLRFLISYSVDPNSNSIRIIGFDVHPVSMQHSPGYTNSDSKLSTCDTKNSVSNNPDSYLTLSKAKGENSLDVVYSYEVKWEPTNISWTDRWDIYLVGSPNDEIHYFSIVNSLMIVVFLTGAVCIIILRTLRKDIAAYNDAVLIEEPVEESGWKLIHGDIFRPPTTYPMLLSVAVGTGVQIGVSFVITLSSALLGVLNPMNKGQTLTSIILLYVFSGSIAGYCSSRLYKFFDAKAWKRATLLTATAFPGLLVTMFLFLDIMLSIAGAATAVSVWTVIAIFLLWTCVSTPLVFVGSYFGYRADKIEVPVKTNQIARFIPETPWYCKAHFSFLLGGILPFGSVSVELLFILGALWLHQIYYTIGFLVFVLLILAATCAEVAIVFQYLRISAEDHQWWWKSFMNCAASGFYLFLYSLWFLSSKLNLVGFLPTMVYLTYMSMISIAFGVFCGAVGFTSCFIFNKQIYSAIKVD